MKTTTFMPKDILKSLQQPAAGEGAAGDASQVHTLLNGLHDHAILFLDPRGNITSWNGGARTLLGFTEAEIIGRNFSCFYPAEDILNGLPMTALAVARESGRCETQGWRLRKNGDRFRADVLIQPVRGAGGDITGFVTLTRDITIRHQVDLLKEDCSQARKQEMIGQLTGGVAQDFNNLLTMIEAGHQLVARYAIDPRVARVLEVNKLAIDKSRRLIAQLLAFSARQVLTPVASDINDTVSVFDVLVERAIGGNRQVQWQLAPDLPQAHIDPGQLQSCLLNLIVNARDAMPHGGTIRIFTGTETLKSPNFKVPHNVEPGHYIVLGIADTGTGMSEALCERAIEPFFTTKAPGQGAGLGLSQCYGFARQSGGTLLIESLEGAGTTVRLLLPALAMAGKPAPHGAHRTVLLVDDEFAIRSLVGEMLRGLGHTVVEAEDPRDALRQLQSNAAIDLLFTDIIMPDAQNRLELLAGARSLRPGLPGLLAGGYPGEVLRNIAQLQDDMLFSQASCTPGRM